MHIFCFIFVTFIKVKQNLLQKKLLTLLVFFLFILFDILYGIHRFEIIIFHLLNFKSTSEYIFYYLCNIQNSRKKVQILLYLVFKLVRFHHRFTY